MYNKPILIWRNILYHVCKNGNFKLCIFWEKYFVSGWQYNKKCCHCVHFTSTEIYNKISHVTQELNNLSAAIIGLKAIKIPKWFDI